MNRHCLSVQPPVQSRFRPNSVSATSIWQVNGAVAFPRVWSSSVARLRRMVLVTVPSPYQRKQKTARICLHWLSCLCRCSHNGPGRHEISSLHAFPAYSSTFPPSTPSNCLHPASYSFAFPLVTLWIKFSRNWNLSIGIVMDVEMR